LATTAGCNTTKVAEAPPNGDETLKTTLRGYVVEFLRRNPTVNTYLGGAGFDPALRGEDGRLRDYSSEALDREDQWLTQTQAAIQAIDPSTLSPNPRIDRDVALAQIAFQLHQHQVRKYQERALDTFTSEPFRALDWQMQGMTQTGANTYGTDQEWRLLTLRVQAIPAYLQRAREQLMAGARSGNVPDGRMIRRDGIDTSEASAKYFADTLPKLGADRITGGQRERLLADLREASAQAAFAYPAGATKRPLMKKSSACPAARDKSTRPMTRTPTE
jgi:uncharacterized protein (DUF885 family)